MKTKLTPAVVGFFVLGALLLGLIALLSFGGVNFFSKPERFVVYFDETIHGLDLGSPVKLRGVRVGRVVDLNVNYDATTGRSRVMVVGELNRNVITDSKGALFDVGDSQRLQDMVKHGMRAQLGVIGLATGLLYVELTFVDPEQSPLPPDNPALAKYPVVPTMPSAISEFQASLTDILSDIKKIDFPGIANNLNGLIGDARKQVNALNLGALGAEWTKAGQSFNQLANAPEIKQTFAELNIAIKQFTTTMARIDAQVDPAGEKLQLTLAQAQETLKSFNSAALTARNFISAQSGLGEDASRALEQLTAAATSVQRLADFLERNPNAVITGKRPPR